jgi:excinuclease ABC subunit C
VRSRPAKEAESGGAREALERKLRLLPARPGVYFFKDGRGDVLYIGKAKRLSSRVRSYFGKDAGARGPRISRLARIARDIDYIVTDTEVEALILEARLIREHQPHYNINLKDDKRYPYLKLTRGHPFPRLLLARRLEEDGSKYFGPYTDVRSLRLTMKLIRTAFPLRSCSDRRLLRDERECLYYFIGQCAAPCTRRIDEAGYAGLVRGLERLLSGGGAEVVEEMRLAMDAASERLDFEEAARLRDGIRALESVARRQKVARAGDMDEDYIGLAAMGDEACVAVLRVREGQLVGKEQRLLSGVRGRPEAEVLSSFIAQFYLGSDEIPRTIVVTPAPEEGDILAEGLSARAGRRVAFHVPERGRPRGLWIMAARNAHLVIEERALPPRAKRIDPAVYDLQRSLGLDAPPVRLECLDVSTLQGRFTVGAVVTFENGRSKKNGYRRYRIRAVERPDDFASVREVVGRRVGRLLSGEGSLPDLLVVDGGAGQVSAAREALRSLGAELPVVGLAKREETVVFADGRRDLRLPASSAGLRLLMRARDEAHRFAVGYHRRLRSRALTASELDGVRGVGPVLKARLLKAFGSVAALRGAGVEEIARVRGVGRRLAEEVLRRMRAGPGDDT